MVTVTDCHFAWLSKADFQRCLDAFEKRKRDTEAAFLRSLPFFGQLLKEKAYKIVANLEPVTRNQALLKEGQSNKYVYIIKSGEFSVRKKLVMNKPVEESKMRDYLQGQKSLPADVRNVFNKKIQQLTKLRKLTHVNQIK